MQYIEFQYNFHQSFDLYGTILGAITYYGRAGEKIHIYESDKLTDKFRETFSHPNFAVNDIVVTADFVVVYPIEWNVNYNFYFEKLNGKWSAFNDTSYPHKFAISYTPDTGALIGYSISESKTELDIFKFERK